MKKPDQDTLAVWEKWGLKYLSTPVGVVLTAAYGKEELLLSVAAELERALPWTEHKPPLWA